MKDVRIRILQAVAALALLLPVLAHADARPNVPELSPASAGSAVGLLVGAGFLLRDRFRNR